MLISRSRADAAWAMKAFISWRFSESNHSNFIMPDSQYPKIPARFPHEVEVLTFFISTRKHLLCRGKRIRVKRNWIPINAGRESIPRFLFQVNYDLSIKIVPKGFLCPPGNIFDRCCRVQRFQERIKHTDPLPVPFQSDTVFTDPCDERRTDKATNRFATTEMRSWIWWMRNV